MTRLERIDRYGTSKLTEADVDWLLSLVQRAEPMLQHVSSETHESATCPACVWLADYNSHDPQS